MRPPRGLCTLSIRAICLGRAYTRDAFFGQRRTCRPALTVCAVTGRVDLQLHSVHGTRNGSGMAQSDAEVVEKLRAALFPDGEVNGKRLADELRRIADVCDEGTGEQRDDQAPGTSGTGRESPTRRPGKRARSRRNRQFDITQYRTRYVALKMMYVGWEYHGFARQEGTGLTTIEDVFFRALRSTRLVPEEVGDEGLQYSRCGRTDKGVSALGQVVALRVRSKAKKTEPEMEAGEEIDYPAVINGALPPDIRVWGWTDVPETFSARFSAGYRIYKYFIVSHRNNPLDIGAMRRAVGFFLGVHNFRNFCKLDVAATIQHVREILECSLEGVEGFGTPDTDVFLFTVKGTAFLYHQVRCMVSVLLMVGKGKEAPEIVQQLLDVEKVPAKPQFVMASELPLILYECGFSGVDFEVTPNGAQKALYTLLRSRDHHAMGAAIANQLMGVISQASGQEPFYKDIRHIPLLDRPTEMSLDERIARRQRRMQNKDNGNGNSNGNGNGTG